MSSHRRWLAAVVVSLIFVPRAIEAGIIDFEIVDFAGGSAGVVVSRGQKKQVASEVVLEAIDCCEPKAFSRSVQLHEGFRLCFSDVRDSHIRGFGMWIRTEPETFGWEWFSRGTGGMLTRIWTWLSSGPDDIFEKLQEGGRLRVRTIAGPEFEEIAEIEFLTDISLRAADLESDKLLYRVNIKRGSVLTVLP